MQNCRAHQGQFVFSDKGLDWSTIYWRGVNLGHIARTGQGHVERSGNRCSRHGDHIHHHSQLFQFFFVSYTEALLFVYHHQTKILEGNIFLQHSMRADNNIALTGSQPSGHFSLLFGCAETTEQTDLDRICGKALRHIVEVLLSQNSGRHEYCYLLA